MKRFKYIFFAAALMLEACDDPFLRIDPVHGDNYGIVLLSAGGEREISAKAGTVTYLPNEVRFAAAMYQETDNDVYNFGTPTVANLVVDDKGAGNSLYMKPDYSTPVHYDNYLNDDDSSIFYWRNRKKHAFIGYIDNYYEALNKKSTYLPKFGVAPSVKKIANAPEDTTVYRFYTVDLTNPSTRTPARPAWEKMSDQPDPLIAGTEQAPQYSAAEKNRAYLTFRHQFSTIRVNLRGHESIGTLAKEQILSVELLGVSEQADIYPFLTERNGRVERDSDTKSIVQTAYGHPVDLRKYTDEQLKANQWGTSFEMFVSDEVDPSLGYTKSFDAIAYGTLEAIRIKWKETDAQGGQLHNVTFVVTDNNFKYLESGKRYIYNLELRRGTLAIVRTVIVDWVPYQIEYSGDGIFHYSHNGHGGYPGHGGY